MAGWVPEEGTAGVVAGGNLVRARISRTALLAKIGISPEKASGQEIERSGAQHHPRSNRAAGAVVVPRCEEDDANKVAVSPDQSAPFHCVKGIKRQLKG